MNVLLTVIQSDNDEGSLDVAMVTEDHSHEGVTLPVEASFAVQLLCSDLSVRKAYAKMILENQRLEADLERTKEELGRYKDIILSLPRQESLSFGTESAPGGGGGILEDDIPF